MATLLYGCETWAIREEDKYRMAAAEMIFMRRMAKYTWQNYKTNEGIQSELKINPAVKKITDVNGYKMFGEWTETDRLPHSIMRYEPCGK
jgi:tRNA(Ile2) C34 agmatinyltransferase TiaS